MSAPGGILALDLSLRVGYVYGHAKERPVAQAWALADTSCLGRCYAQLDNELSAAIAVFKPRLIVGEAALRIIDNSSRLLAGLWATAEQAAYRAGVDIQERAASTVRPAVMGIGAGQGRSEVIKRRVMAWCRAQGFTVNGDDEADAIVLWLYETGFRAPMGMRYGEQQVAA